MSRRLHRWKLPLGIAAPHQFEQLACPPVGVPLAQRHQLIGGRFIYLPGASMGAARELLVSSLAMLLLSIDPHVGRSP